MIGEEEHESKDISIIRSAYETTIRVVEMVSIMFTTEHY